MEEEENDEIKLDTGGDTRLWCLRKLGKLLGSLRRKKKNPRIRGARNIYTCLGLGESSLELCLNGSRRRAFLKWGCFLGVQLVGKHHQPSSFLIGRLLMCLGWPEKSPMMSPTSPPQT